MLQLLLVIGLIYCAYRVMRTQRLLISTMWLAATSALTSILLYSLGAHEVAVIELSVGAGLVTVLFVFAFSIVGEVTWDPLTIVPRPLVWFLILCVSLALGWFTLPVESSVEATSTLPFGVVLWQQRGLDVMVQIMLIFAGVIGLMGLLAEKYNPYPVDKKVAARAQAAKDTQAALSGSNGHSLTPETAENEVAL